MPSKKQRARLRMSMLCVSLLA